MKQSDTGKLGIAIPKEGRPQKQCHGKKRVDSSNPKERTGEKGKGEKNSEIHRKTKYSPSETRGKAPKNNHQSKVLHPKGSIF